MKRLIEYVSILRILKMISIVIDGRTRYEDNKWIL